MADYGATYTDKTITELDKEIQAVYKEAEKDIQKKMDDFNAKYKIKEQKYQQKVDSGQMTQEEFDRWKKGQVFQGQQWQAKKDQILNTIHHSNEIATKIINGQSQNIFMVNANYMSYDMEHGAGVNFGFGLYDQNTVANLIADDPKLLPEWKINEKKDYVWSQKKLNNAITQGIIQGESLDKISKRISDKLASTNENKMKTFARTAMTGAQNSGRQMQLENAQKLDIEVQKEWMATLDARTRDSHRDMDGEKVDVGKEFSNGLMFPGDPNGAPAQTYNCRCTMVSDVKKYPATYDRYDAVAGRRISNISYRDWENEKRKQMDAAEAKNNPFADKSMSKLYYEMRDKDSKLANQFYKELGSMGKPSEIWNQYIMGTYPGDTSKLTQILNDYAQQIGINMPKAVTEPDYKNIFGNKSMSKLYYEMRDKDSKLANGFYKDLGKMGKPSEVWSQYLNGTLDKDKAKQLENYLSKYNAILNPTAAVIPKPEVKIPPVVKKPAASKAKATAPKSKTTASASKFDEKWFNKNIKDNGFSSGTKFDEDIKKEMIKQLEKTPDAYKQTFIGTLKKIKNVNYDDGRSYYKDGSRIININLERKMKECKHYENPLHVYFHEMGHAIDYNATPDGLRFTSGTEFKKAFKKDIEGLNKKISSGLGKLNSLRLDDESRGLQDIFSSLPYLNEKGEFKGKINSRANYIRYNFAHSSDYWRRNDNPAVDARSELFAHLSAAQCSKKQQEYMKEYFPNCWEAFNDLISNSKFVK